MTKLTIQSQMAFFSQVKEQESVFDREGMHNGLSTTALSPSSAAFLIRGRDRASGNYMPLRSASMRETSYSRSIRRSRQKAQLNSTGDSNTLSVQTRQGNGTSEQNINAIQEAA